MLTERLQHISDPDVASLLDELEQVTGLTVLGHSEHALFSFLSMCQRDVIKDKKRRIDASHFYAGSLLKTKVEKLPLSVRKIVDDLCLHFRVPVEVIETKTL